MGRKKSESPDKVGDIRSLLDEAEGSPAPEPPRKKPSEDLDLDAAWDRR